MNTRLRLTVPVVAGALSFSFVGVVPPCGRGVLPLDRVVVAHPLAAALGADELPPRLSAQTAALHGLARGPWFGCEAHGLVVVEGRADHAAVVQTHLTMGVVCLKEGV